MKHIESPSDLGEYGIVFLTGESCALMFRVLYDVTEPGRLIICRALGLPSTTKFSEEWNSGTAEQPHVGSIMLSHDMLETISIFALLSLPNITAVYTTWNSGVYAVEADDNPQLVERWLDYQKRHYEAGKRGIKRHFKGGAADRNRHQFTGRVE